MKSIGVCIVVNSNDSLSQTKLFIENILSKSRNAVINFYILSNNCNSDMKNYLEAVTNSLFDETQNPKSVQNFIHLEQSINYYQAYNKLFVMVKEDFICAIPNGIFVNNYWYGALLNSAEHINNSGIISIHTGVDKCYFTSTLSDIETMATIIKPCDQDELLTGLYFMKTSVVRIIGGFELELFGTGYERNELCWRFRKNKYVNYYVKGQNCIDTMITETLNQKQSSSKSVYDKVIDERIKNKVYKTQF